MNQLPDNNSPEKALFELRFSSTIPLSKKTIVSYFENTDFNPSDLGIENLTSAQILYQEQTAEDEIGRPRTDKYLILNVSFEEFIRKNKTKYEEINKAAIDQINFGHNGDFYLKYFQPYVAKFHHLRWHLIQYLIWRYGLIEGDNIWKNMGNSCKWSIDSKEGSNPLTNIYMLGEVTFTVNIPEIELKTDDFSDFTVSYKRSGNGIPLHREILVEAEFLKNKSRFRSALLMIYTALEVGTKSLLTYKNPDATWLVEHTSTPDIVKIHKEYLPAIIEDPLTSEELDLLRKLTSQRNIIAHSGRVSDKLDIDKYFSFAEKALYKIESNMDYKWAKDVYSPSKNFPIGG
ncbi:hypothetical protein [Fibrivirga algicola]|uniref:Apea-like HEPN domain-containing protein n=1 Tax=Fibrivirga algicola TaxID=2950420 RepID=A0ABX0QBC9_9BACT|nr:hypothetical protein [Fibrivirga algicola]NID09394.1 hypothetical protein [Fibrivirga algicola]